MSVVRKTLICLLSVVSLFCCFTAKASEQSFKQFSGKDSLFTNELRLFMSKIEDDSALVQLGTFTALWDSAKISSENKKLVVRTAIGLIDKKFRPFPDFMGYINVVIILNNKYPQHSKAWLEAMAEKVESKRVSATALRNVLANTIVFFKQQVLYKAPSLSWVPSSLSFVVKNEEKLIFFFPKTDLVCHAKRDSIIIKNTSGSFDPFENKWYGKGGLVTWERAGYSVDSVSAILSDYKIELSRTSYQADSVSFTNKSFFSAPMLGKLEDNVMFVSKPENAQYPQFDSYVKEYNIKNIYPDVNYKGGVSMQGAKLIGSGTVYDPAKLYFYLHDTLKLVAGSVTFGFKPHKVTASNAIVTIFLEKDSIYHGDVQFTYVSKNKELTLEKSDNYVAQSPFLNTYHNIDMNFDRMVWHIDEPFILLTSALGSSAGKGIFESVNYFKYEEFEALQYYDDKHPLSQLKKCSQYYNGDRYFTAIDFANFIKRPMDQVRTLLFPLAVKGYIYYDPSTEKVELKDRLFDALQSSIGRKDYDVLRFISNTSAPLENASLNLRNFDLTVHGIPAVFVSDSQNVKIYPKARTIKLKHNRSFQFDGIVEAGLFTFFGRNFFFNYDSFKVSLGNVDSIRMKVIVGYDLAMKPIYQDVNNVIQDVTGDVLIDAPDNKSGVVNHPEYPIFTSRGNSYVYYDHPSIFGGVYKRSREFYFRIEPYVLDSLDNFSKEGMKFNGYLSSAKIFPNIDEKLVLQPDFSLGFTHDVPDEGFLAYGGKGRFSRLLNLSNQGLRGKGHVKYLTATVRSEDIIFFPDSMDAVDDFTIEAQAAPASYPTVDGKAIKVNWQPYKDVMYARNTVNEFDMYSKQANFNGTLALTPKKLAGKGMVNFPTADDSSKNFTFFQMLAHADTSCFRMKSSLDRQITVKANNVKSDINFATRIGDFKTNDTAAITEFPENRYIAKIDLLKWYMNKDELAMSSTRKNTVAQEGKIYGFKDEPLVGARFMSVAPLQDSLWFVSGSAVYINKTKSIEASKVKYLDIADARIFPNEEKIAIDSISKVQLLNKSKILANRETRFHNIYDATIDIASRKMYKASGKYNYVPVTNVPEVVSMHTITVDSTNSTFTDGTIVEPDSFTLSPDFMYQGRAQIFAKEKYLTFDGSTKIVVECPNTGTSWFDFNTVIDPTDIKIPVGDTLKEINDKKIVLGSYLRADTIMLYSTMFGTRKFHSDSSLIKSKGVLVFNKKLGNYEVASEEKLKNRNLPGQLITYNRKSCRFYGEGKLKTGVTLGQMKLLNAGNIDHDLNSNKVKLHMAMSVKFHFYQPSLEITRKYIDSLCRDSIKIKTPYFRKVYGEFADTAAIRKFFTEYDLPILSEKEKDNILPEAFKSTIFIDDINLVWNQATKSFRSEGKIGIGFIGGKPLHRWVNGYVEIWRKRSGDVMDIYLQVDEKSYFYFGYTRGAMWVASSDKQFELPIREMSMKERSITVGRFQTPYSFVLSPQDKVIRVVRRWKNGTSEEDIQLQNQEDIEETPELQIEEQQAAPNDSVQ